MDAAHRERIDTLARLAAHRRLAELNYRTRLTPAPEAPRLVEPYALLQGTQDVLVRCYQLRPTQGWRTFMAHKIDRVVDTGVAFTPRQPVTIAGDRSPLFGLEAAAEAPWTPDLMLYRDLIAEALAHGLVDEEKLAEIHLFAERAGLRPEQVRWAHAVLFRRALDGVIRDGAVGRSQIAELDLVRRVLSGLGWGVASSPRRSRTQRRWRAVA